MNKITHKLFKKLFLLISVGVIIGYFIVISLFLKEEKRDSLRLAKETYTIISQDLAKLIFLNDVNFATDITTKLKSLKKIKKVILYRKNQPIYQYENKDLKGNFVTFKTSAIYKGKKIGDIVIISQYESIEDVIKEYWAYMVIYYLILLLLTNLFVKYVSKTISEPILNLVEFLEKIDFNSLSKRIKNPYNDEIGKLYNQTNKMLFNLQNSLNEIEKLKNYDSLTGVMKKNIFLEKIKPLKNSKYALICLNIKNFKAINDLYSHKIGDKLLITLANKLKKDFEEVTRIHADQFALLTKKEDIEKKINLLNSNEYKKFKIDNIELEIEFYIAILDIEKNIDLIKECDLAIKLAKKEKNHISFYDKTLEKETLKDLLIVKKLKQALKNRELTLFYQPLYTVNKEMFGAEALIRWINKEKGIIPPNEFIPIAEKSDLIVEIGDFVLEEVIKQLSIWQKENKNLSLSVNISSKQFDDNLIEKIKNLIKNYQVNPNNLKIELLESILFENNKETIERMKKIKKLGIKIALDDFGTGFSSLQYLATLPIDIVKIDQSFVFHMFESKENLIIIEEIIRLGKKLNMKVLAEGVETERHFEKLKELGCEYFQGYYFSKPLPLNKFEKLLKD